MQEKVFTARALAGSDRYSYVFWKNGNGGIESDRECMLTDDGFAGAKPREAVKDAEGDARAALESMLGWIDDTRTYVSGKIESAMAECPYRQGDRIRLAQPNRKLENGKVIDIGVVIDLADMSCKYEWVVRICLLKKDGAESTFEIFATPAGIQGRAE